jgi:hypothetical protein
MAFTPPFVVSRTFLELAEESRLRRPRFNSEGVLSIFMPDNLDGGLSTDRGIEVNDVEVTPEVAYVEHCCSPIIDVESSLSTDCGSEADSTVSCRADQSGDELDARTTVMLRGLDSSMDREKLLRVLNASRFRGCFDFIYAPCDLSTQKPKGFGFVNFISHMDAHEFLVQSLASLGLGADAQAFWSDKEQGLAENVGRYRNSPIMHRSVPKHFRPSLVRMDSLVPLPQPTRTLKPPKVKRASS